MVPSLMSDWFGWVKNSDEHFKRGEYFATLEMLKGEEITTEIDGFIFKAAFASTFIEDFARTIENFSI